jgi:hypothetical protein
MLSISEMLAYHHDAKLLPKPAADGARHEIPAARRRQPPAPFRAGLRVKIGVDAGHERGAVARWNDPRDLDVTITELA